MKNIKIKKVSSLEKVFVSKEPDDYKNCKFNLLKNESFSFQFAYYYGGDQKDEMSLQILGDLKDKFKVRFVNLVPCEYPCGLRYDENYLSIEPGLYPDLLSCLNIEKIPLISGQWRSIWIDLEDFKDVKVKNYDVKFVFKKDGKIIKSFNMSFNILDGFLKKLPIYHTEWFHGDCLADYYGCDVFSKRHWEIIENFIKTACKRGCNMIFTPIFTPPLDTALNKERTTIQLIDIELKGSKYYFNFEKFKKWIRIAKKCGMEYFEISHLFSQWGAKFPPKIIVKKNKKDVKMFGWHTKVSSLEYQKFIKAFLNEFVSVLKKMKIEKNTFFHISDEPQLKDFKTYKFAKKIVSEELKDFKVIDAISDYEFYKNGLIKNPVCGLDLLKPFLDNDVENLWCYYCTSQWNKVSNRFITMPSVRTRILGLLIYKFNLKGFLHWGYNFYNTQYSLEKINPYIRTDAAWAFPSGDSFLVYPSKDGTPEESIRLMLMKDAMEDIKLLYFLEEHIGRENVLKIIENKKYKTLTFEDYPIQKEYFYELRNKIDKILKKIL